VGDCNNLCGWVVHTAKGDVMKKEKPIEILGLVIWSIVAIVSLLLCFDGSYVMQYIAIAFTALSLIGWTMAANGKELMWRGKLYDKQFNRIR